MSRTISCINIVNEQRSFSSNIVGDHRLQHGRFRHRPYEYGPLRTDQRRWDQCGVQVVLGRLSGEGVGYTYSYQPRQAGNSERCKEAPLAPVQTASSLRQRRKDDIGVGVGLRTASTSALTSLAIRGIERSIDTTALVKSFAEARFLCFLSTLFEPP